MHALARIRSLLGGKPADLPAPLVFPLESERLQLRPFVEADVAAMRRVYGDPQVMRWVGYGPIATEDGVRGMLAQYATHQRAHGFAFWAVIERASGELIGDAGLALTGAGEIEMGYTLARDRWGAGLGTEVALLCSHTALHVLGYPQVRALVEPENAASRHVLEKAGFREDGSTVAFGRPHVVMRRHRAP